jgi:hypothetical protein
MLAVLFRFEHGLDSDPRSWTGGPQEPVMTLEMGNVSTAGVEARKPYSTAVTDEARAFVVPYLTLMLNTSLKFRPLLGCTEAQNRALV